MSERTRPRGREGERESWRETGGWRGWREGGERVRACALARERERERGEGGGREVVLV